jgi:hypothetical protein
MRVQISGVWISESVDRRQCSVCRVPFEIILQDNDEPVARAYTQSWARIPAVVQAAVERQGPGYSSASRDNQGDVE